MRSTAVACAVVLVIGAPTTSGTAYAAPAASTTVGVDQAGAVHLFTQSHPDRFAGVVLDEANRSLRVYAKRAGLSAATTELGRIAAALPKGSVSSTASPSAPLRVTVVPVERTLRDLDRVMVDVEKREPFASLAGKKLSVWHVNPETNRVRVGLTSVTPADRAAAAEAFGDLVELVQHDRQRAASTRYRVPNGVKVERQTVTRQTASTALAAVPNRRLDSMPYYGATRVVRTWVQDGQTWVGECTVAFQVYVNGGSTRNQTTAGHCAPTGTVWQQGYFDRPASTIRTTGTMGTTSSVQWGNNRMDAATIRSGSYWVGAVYTGNNFSEISYGVAGRRAVVVGDSVCADGSTTGSNCGGRVTGVNACINLDDHGTIVRVCNQALATSANALSQPGDSGGPVFKLSAGNPNRVDAVGIISGGNDPGTSMNFTQWMNVESTFGVTVGVGNPA